MKEVEKQFLIECVKLCKNPYIKKNGITPRDIINKGGIHNICAQ